MLITPRLLGDSPRLRLQTRGERALGSAQSVPPYNQRPLARPSTRPRAGVTTGTPAPPPALPLSVSRERPSPSAGPLARPHALSPLLLLPPFTLFLVSPFSSSSPFLPLFLVPSLPPPTQKEGGRGRRESGCRRVNSIKRASHSPYRLITEAAARRDVDAAARLPPSPTPTPPPADAPSRAGRGGDGGADVMVGIGVMEERRRREGKEKR